VRPNPKIWTSPNLGAMLHERIRPQRSHLAFGGRCRMVTGTEVGTAIKVAEVISRAVPKGYELVKSWWTAKEFLVVGQARAGKTTFCEYLRLGFFDDARRTEETPEVERSGRFNIELGRDKALKLVVSNAVDIPGPVGAVEHANLAFERNPHAIIVILDLTTPLHGEPDRASGDWLSRFCKRLEVKWRVDRKRKNKLAAMIVVMNKLDASNSEYVAEAEVAYRKILAEELRDARGKMSEEISVLSSIMVTNADGTKLVDAVIRQLARSLTR
jgi:GTPase SAR1 family protein